MTGPVFVFPRFDGNPLCADADDPDLWFPEKGNTAHAAKNICSRCEVSDQCLAWAMEHEKAGIWSGLSETERRRLRKTAPRRYAKPIRHGTDAGASQHRRRGEDPCPSCTRAAAAALAARQNRDQCPVCGGWMLKANLRRHMTRRHPDAQENVA